MKTWCAVLTAIVLALLVLALFQQAVISELRIDAAKDRRVTRDHTITAMMIQWQLRSQEQEQHNHDALLMRHNDLLIHNVVNGRLERPNAKATNSLRGDREK